MDRMVRIKSVPDFVQTSIHIEQRGAGGAGVEPNQGKKQRHLTGMCRLVRIKSEPVFCPNFRGPET
jgi:hypothetical protein